MTVGRILLFSGFVFLTVMVFTHVAERLQLLSSVGWGLPDSPGHYLDFVSAVLGCALFYAPATRNAHEDHCKSCHRGRLFLLGLFCNRPIDGSGSLLLFRP
jgi:hypothetical protein